MDDLRLKTIVFEMLSEIRFKAPRDTGNLAENALQMYKSGTGEYTIELNMDIAPYQEYLDDEGSKHQGWFDRVVKEAIQTQAMKFNARIE